jgi:3',5'-cyclic AMP phosphodiesterase CpdA
MAIRHQLSVATPYGVLISPSLAFSTLEWVLAENDAGVLTCIVDDSYPLDWFSKDAIMTIGRSINGGPFYTEGDAAWLIRKRVRAIEPDGSTTLTITALHANSILARRIVAYATGSAQADQSGAADDLIKQIVRDNFVTATDTARNTTLINVTVNGGAAPTIAMEFARRAVADTARDLADASAASGVYLGYEIRWTGSVYQVVTYTTSRAADRRVGGAQPLIFSQAYGNVGTLTITEDWTDEVTAAYAYGGDANSVGTALNTAAIGESPLGRIEGLRTGSQSTTTADLDDEAAADLYQKRPKAVIDGSAIDTERCIYGIDYVWGTLATLEAPGFSADVRIDPVHCTVANGVETRDIRLTAELTL